MDKPRLPFTLQTHTGSPTGYAETAASIMRDCWNEGLEVHYLYNQDDPLYEATSMDHMVDGLRSIEPEVGLPQVVYSVAPIFWHNGGKYKIGWTMMEVDGISDQWVRACNSQDEIWVPTPFQAEFFKESGVEVPIRVVPLGYDKTRYHPGITPAIYHPEAKFRFLGLGWWQLRKRWDILLEAFDEEFGGDKNVSLILKTMCQDDDAVVMDRALSYVSPASRDQIAIICGPLPWWEISMIMRGCQAFVSATSGEGWGCPPLQALSAGLPVVITDCLGPGEVLRDNKGVPYPGVLFIPSEKEVCKVGHPYYEGRNWWVIDKENLKQGMRAVYENYQKWEEAAARGSARVRRERSSTETAKVIRKELTRVYKIMEGEG